MSQELKVIWFTRNRRYTQVIGRTHWGERDNLGLYCGNLSHAENILFDLIIKWNSVKDLEQVFCLHLFLSFLCVCVCVCVCE